jgi:hypothetical protein
MENKALKTWQKKLEFLQTEEAITSDPEQKFSLQEKMAECRQKIQEIKDCRDSRADNANPFGDRGKITNIERFYDREDLFSEIYSELRKGVNISLVGESQVGKSSVLSILEQRSREYPEIPVIYLDMQLILDENQFFEELCLELNISPPCRGKRLKRVLGEKRYILCLDEIEKMTRKEYFSGSERSDLRGLAEGENTPLTLLIASRSPLAHLFPDSPAANSPLDNICRTIKIEPFSLSVAKNFLEHRLQGTGINFSASEAEDLWAQSHGNPGRLQATAFELYQKKLMIT